MLIDSHTHIGQIDYTVGKNKVSHLSGDDLIRAMQKYSIDIALVSSIEGAEFDSEGNLAPNSKQVPQLQSFTNLVSFIKGIKVSSNHSTFPSFSKGGVSRHRRDGVVRLSSLKALLWIKPYTETVTTALEQFISTNSQYIAGFKMHPSLSRVKFTDERFIPYIELAKKFDMPVQVHSENDGYSNIEYIESIAGKYPQIDFVMVHMGLGTENTEAIDIIKHHNNIYGDTCEVKHENVIRAIKECGSDKILFGTDAIVHGIDTYSKYLPLITQIREEFTTAEAENVMRMNCIRLFNLQP